MLESRTEPARRARKGEAAEASELRLLAQIEAGLSAGQPAGPASVVRDLPPEDQDAPRMKAGRP